RANSRFRGLEGERDGDRPRARADVEDPRRGDPARPRERRLDQRLGLRPRNQHRAVDLELPREEFLRATDTLQRLAAAAAPDPFIEASPFRVAERPIEFDVEATALHAEYVGEQQLRIEARIVDAVLGEK